MEFFICVTSFYMLALCRKRWISLPHFATFALFVFAPDSYRDCVKFEELASVLTAN